MKVKIGNTVYDAEKTPIMLILTDLDKDNIKNMHPTAEKFILFPEDEKIEEIKNWAEVD